jgi:pyruvate-formate lyase-activating enzyme
MKIMVKSEKIIKAVEKMYGIEIELETAGDAKEAIELILNRMGGKGMIDYKQVKEIEVTSLKHYETSAVDYKMTFLLLFSFEEGVPLEKRVAVIKDFQEFFSKV